MQDPPFMPPFGLEQEPDYLFPEQDTCMEFLDLHPDLDSHLVSVWNELSNGEISNFQFGS